MPYSTGTYMLGGEFFPKDPIQKNWTRERVDRHGTHEPIFAAPLTLVLTFGITDSENVISFFYQKYIQTTLQTARLPHPETGALVDFYDVDIGEFINTFNDFGDGNEYSPMKNTYSDGVRLTIKGISLSNTGTAT